jgi:hypothetical protein
MTILSSRPSPSLNKGLCPLNHGQWIGTCERAAGGDSGGERATLEHGECKAFVIVVLLTTLWELSCNHSLHFVGWASVISRNKLIAGRVRG